MKLSNLMGVDTYKEAIKEIELENEALVDTNQKLHDQIAELEKQLQLYKADDEEKLNILREDVKGLEETYMKRIAEAENMITLAKADCDIAEQKAKDMDLKIHRAFAEGRMAAYSELGVRVIKAHEHGDEIKVVVNDDAEIDEVIEVMSDEKLADFIEKEDIDIDDLVDIL